MHPADIQAELKKREITQKEIADKLGVSPMAVSMAIHKTLISDRVLRAIAKTINRDHREVFSEYYFRKNRRGPKQPKPKV